jgi:DNA-binding response OmpR family regulator
MPDVLLVEDEKRIVTALDAGLTPLGYCLHAVVSVAAARDWLACNTADLIILDLMLPDGSGLELLRSLRLAAPGVHLRPPVLVLSARGSVQDRVRALDLGADDYLGKPFAFAELKARLRALERRGTAAPTRHSYADLRLDPARRRVTRAGQPLALTLREFDLLALLVERAGDTVSREEIARLVFHLAAGAAAVDRALDVHITHLRHKLEAGGGGRLVHTVRGVGYRLAEEAP